MHWGILNEIISKNDAPILIDRFDVRFYMMVSKDVAVAAENKIGFVPVGYDDHGNLLRMQRNTIKFWAQSVGSRDGVFSHEGMSLRQHQRRYQHPTFTRQNYARGPNREVRALSLLSQEEIENKPNIEKDENNRNPLLDVRQGLVDIALSLFKELPFIGVEGRGKLLLKFMHDFEFHGIQVSVVLHE